jgi:Ca2+-binding EF-hand superfamily protein
VWRDQRLLFQRGDPMTKEEVQAIIDEVDENNDGKLDYKEVILLQCILLPCTL